MKLILFWLFFLVCKLFYCQTIELHSITTSRQTGGDNGYTLDGIWMSPDPRNKLLNSANFSPTGTYPKNINITDGYGLSGDLETISQLPTQSIFFFGCFNIADPTTKPFTIGEVDSLYNWSMRGGKVIVTSGLKAEIGIPIDFTILNSKWNYSSSAYTDQTFFPTSAGDSTELFNGPFGNVDTVKQKGSVKGYFNHTPTHIVTFGRTENGLIAAYMDCKTLDLMIVDVDVYTYLGVFHSGDPTLITSDNDRFLANTIVFMDKLQDQPLLVKAGDTLSVQNNYLSYQWFNNGQPILGANTPSFLPVGIGNYYAEVKVNGGCKLQTIEYIIKSPPENVPVSVSECEVFVPTAFSPDNNSANDNACVYGSCLSDITFNIFDRWGELVFESKDITACWDGNYKGQKAKEGVYAWTLQGLQSGNKIKKKGNITLVR